MSTLRDARWVGAFTAIVTPFSADGTRIDEERLKEQVAFQAKGGVKGIVIAGTTGESPTLHEDEYKRLAVLGVKLAHGHGMLAVVGTGSNSTEHAMALQRYAASIGADAGLCVNPYYNKPVQEGLYRHFWEVAGSSPLPVMLYNIPGRTGVALTPATVERLARHPRIVAVKEATGSTDSASEIASRCPDVALLSGDDSMTLPFASVGGVGVVSVVSNLVPGKVTELCAAFRKGDQPTALRVHRELFALCRAMFVETNPIPIKAAMRLLGRDSGALRLPMTPATEETERTVRAALTAAALV